MERFKRHNFQPNWLMFVFPTYQNTNWSLFIKKDVAKRYRISLGIGDREFRISPSFSISKMVEIVQWLEYQFVMLRIKVRALFSAQF